MYFFSLLKKAKENTQQTKPWEPTGLCQSWASELVYFRRTNVIFKKVIHEKKIVRPIVTEVKFHYSTYKNDNNEVLKMSTNRPIKSYFIVFMTIFTIKYVMQQAFSGRRSVQHWTQAKEQLHFMEFT